jgi:hypothetical protein
MRSVRIEPPDLGWLKFFERLPPLYGQQSGGRMNAFLGSCSIHEIQQTDIFQRVTVLDPKVAVILSRLRYATCEFLIGNECHDQLAFFERQAHKRLTWP